MILDAKAKVTVRGVLRPIAIQLIVDREERLIVIGVDAGRATPGHHDLHAGAKIDSRLVIEEVAEPLRIGYSARGRRSAGIELRLSVCAELGQDEILFEGVTAVKVRMCRWRCIARARDRVSTARGVAGALVRGL